MTKTWNQAAFTAELGEIRVHADEKSLAARSHDYFWYSPILNDQLKDLRGELLVMPQTVEEVKHVASLVARHLLGRTTAVAWRK